MLLTEPFFNGNRYRVCGLEVNGRCAAWDYLETMTDGDRKRMTALLVRAANDGPPMNKEKFRTIRKIFEFKSGGHLITGFFLPNRHIVLVDGFKKGPAKEQKGHFDRTERLRAEFVSMGGGTPK